MSNKIFTQEQYKAEYKRIMNDDRYTVMLKHWAIDKLKEIYRKRNKQEPPNIETEGIKFNE